MIRFHIIRARRHVAPTVDPPETQLRPVEYAEHLAHIRKQNLEVVELRMQAATNLGHDLEPYQKAIERYSMELEEALRLLDIEREIQRIEAQREAANV